MSLGLNNTWLDKLLPRVLARETGVLCEPCTDDILKSVLAGDITWLSHTRCATEWQRIRLEFSKAVIKQHPESLYE